MQGTLKAPIKAHFYLFFGISRAHMGPARALEEREKIKEIHVFLSNPFFSKIMVFDLQTKFFDGEPLFFRFLAEIRLRTAPK